MRRGRSAEKCGGFELVERAMCGNVAPCLGDPWLNVGGAGQAHGLRERLIYVTSHEPLLGPLIARIRIDRRTLRGMHFDQGTELASEIGPPAVLWPTASQVWSKRFIIADKVVKPHRLTRCGDDGGDGLLVLRPEAVDQQRLEVS